MIIHRRSHCQASLQPRFPALDRDCPSSSVSPTMIRLPMSTAVLIVNYRAYGDLARCLASLQPHIGDDDEVAVVDYESDAAALEAARRATMRA